MTKESGWPIVEVLVLFAIVFVIQFITALADLVGGLFVLSPPLSENPWTIVTSVYAHAGLGHLVSNAVALIIFGWPVARATTRPRFHLFFVITGALAGISQIVLSELLATLPILMSNQTTGVLGASGAVFALLGYLLASNRIATGIGARIEIPRVLTYLLFVIVAIVVTIATAAPGVALIAHFTGLLLGLFSGRFNLLRIPSRNA